MKQGSTTYSDKKLIQMLGEEKAKSDLAFKILYDKYASRLHAYCLRILGNREQAEDIFQETFVRFYQNAKAEKLRDGSIAGFLIVIARNLCLNHKRDKKSSVEFSEFHSLLIDDNNESKEEAHKLITMALDLLSFEFKEPLVLRLYDGLSYEEISGIIGISNENARKRVFRAKQKIKEILEPYYKEING